MVDIQRDLTSLAKHLASRHEAILLGWQTAIKRDASLKSGDSLPRAQLVDHISGILDSFERALSGPTRHAGAAAGTQAPAAEHGIERWRQGYDLREVTRELGKLNESMVAEIDAFAADHPETSLTALSVGRRLWATLSSTGIEESVARYFDLQQREAASQTRDLERALEDIRRLELERADIWRQAAHDLRGNLGVVANATVGLTHSDLRESARDQFVRILMRNVTSLHHLIDDVTSLARLQAGRETRRLELLDVTPILVDLCEGVRPLAEQQRLFLRCKGPPALEAEGDPVKIRRIAQNLILNAVKYTREGGITVSWGYGDLDDPRRWTLSIEDTGPGLQAPAVAPIAEALQRPPSSAKTAVSAAQAPASAREGGEGIGLAIVKRLCDMLDAEIEMHSVPGAGTTFHILFPRRYHP